MLNLNNPIYSYIYEKVTIENVIKFFILYFFVLWISLLVWVYKDITNRTDNFFYQFISILIILIFTPIFWILIYLIIRPWKTLLEKYYEEIEFNLDDLSKVIEEKFKDCKTKK